LWNKSCQQASIGDSRNCISHPYHQIISLNPADRLETPGHLPICFALATISLDIRLPKAEFMFLFLHVRTIVSSAIRLSLLGPYQGQTIMYNSKALVEKLLTIKGCDPNDAFQTNPILDILQGSHDRLYTRIFNS
jgi:urease accessory protein